MNEDNLCNANLNVKTEIKEHMRLNQILTGISDRKSESHREDDQTSALW